MKQLHLDFASPTWRKRLLDINALTWLLLALGSAWLGWGCWQHWHLQQDLLQQQARMQELQKKLNARGNNKPVQLQTTVTEAKAKSVNNAIARLNLPWHDLMDALEAATPNSIALLTLDPDPKTHLLRVTAEAKNSRDMTTYLKNLKVAGFFDSVLLTRHEINEQDPNRPLRFQFEARWLIGFDTLPEGNGESLLEEILEKTTAEKNEGGKKGLDKKPGGHNG